MSHGHGSEDVQIEPSSVTEPIVLQAQSKIFENYLLVIMNSDGSKPRLGPCLAIFLRLVLKFLRRALKIEKRPSKAWALIF